MILKSSALADDVLVPIAATAFDVNRVNSTLANIADIEATRNQPLASVLLTRWRSNLNISNEVV